MPNRQWNYVGDCGEFRSTVDFTVTGSTDIAGVIIQSVHKKSTLDVYDPLGGGYQCRLDTTSQVDRFTSHNVLYSNDSYIEYFDVLDGEVVDPLTGEACGDQFGNGPLVRYDKCGPIVDDEQDNGEGSVNQIGLLFFVSKPNADALLREYQWMSAPHTSPANGLPYIPYNPHTWLRMLRMASSPVYKHEVTCRWTYLSICKLARNVGYSDTWSQFLA